MKTYVEIHCPIERLSIFLNDFAHVPVIAFSDKREPNKHYIGFEHSFGVAAAKEFAKKNGCQAIDIDRDKVLLKYRSGIELDVSTNTTYDPLKNPI